MVAAAIYLETTVLIWRCRATVEGPRVLGYSLRHPPQSALAAFSALVFCPCHGWKWQPPLTQERRPNPREMARHNSHRPRTTRKLRPIAIARNHARQLAFLTHPEGRLNSQINTHYPHGAWNASYNLT